MKLEQFVQEYPAGSRFANYCGDVFLFTGWSGGYSLIATSGGSKILQVSYVQMEFEAKGMNTCTPWWERLDAHFFNDFTPCGLHNT